MSTATATGFVIHGLGDRLVERDASQNRLAQIAVGREADEPALGVDDRRRLPAVAGDGSQGLPEQRPRDDESGVELTRHGCYSNLPPPWSANLDTLRGSLFKC